MTRRPARLQQVIDLYERRGVIEAIESGGVLAANHCLARAMERLRAAEQLMRSEFWDASYTTAYDAYRTAADALVLMTGYRTVATRGAREAALAVAAASLKSPTVFDVPTSTIFRQGRAASEYFDPERPDDKTEDDAQWAIDQARAACGVVERTL